MAAAPRPSVITDVPPIERPPRRFWVLIASVALLLVGGGVTFVVVVGLKPIAMEFGWPRSVPSLAFSLQFVGSGLGAIAMGHALDRLGMGKPALIGSLSIGAGAIAASQITEAWQLHLIYGVLIGFLGIGSLAAPLMANITKWYEHRRGMAVGIVASGQSLAGIVWPPVFGYAQDTIGWRDTFFWFGIVALAVMVPLCLVVRPRPPTPGTTPGRAEATAGGARRRDKAGAQARPLSPRVLQSGLCVAVVCCCVAMSMPVAHIVSYVTDLGHDITNAVEILSVLLMSTFISRSVLVGLLSERLGGLWALIAFSGLQAVTLSVLGFTDGLIALYVVAALFGLGFGGVFPVYTVIVREHAGRWTGMVFMFGAGGMGLGSWIGGVMFDLTGTYFWAFLIGVGFNVVNLLIILALKLRSMPMRHGGGAEIGAG
jgi:MFS family permease